MPVPLRPAARIAALAGLLALSPYAGAKTVNVLFVGNSFTYGHVAPVSTYRPNTITDLNGSRYGGVPAILEQLTEQAGLDYTFAIEAVGGKTLDFHLQNKAELIDKPGWDVVVLQGYSTEPLPKEHGGKPDVFTHAATELVKLLRAKNPDAAVYLYETWAFPAGLKPGKYPPSDAGMRQMQGDLTAAYFDLARELNCRGVVRTGEAFLTALEQKAAGHTPYARQSAATEPSGAVDLYDAKDHKHASALGSYLSAAVMFATLTGADPRTLTAGPGTAAAHFGITAADAARLHRIAYDVARRPKPPATRPAGQ